MEKTTVKDFIDKYLISSKEVQNEMMDKIVLRKYMPYEAKVVLSKKIIASHRLDKEGYVNSDTCSMHLSLIASILQYYTYFFSSRIHFSRYQKRPFSAYQLR